MVLVNNLENSIKISKTEHLTKSTNHWTEATEMEELKSTPAKDITEETTAESFYNTFDKKDHNSATEALKRKSHKSDFRDGKWWERRSWSKSKKPKETVFVAGVSMIKKKIHD